MLTRAFSPDLDVCATDFRGVVSCTVAGEAAGDLDEPLPGILVGADLSRFVGGNFTCSTEPKDERRGVSSNFLTILAALEACTGSELCDVTSLGVAERSGAVAVTAMSVLPVGLLAKLVDGLPETSRTGTG